MSADPRTVDELRRPTEVELFSLAGHDGHLREVNDAFARLLGRAPGELDGQSLLELAHPQDLAEIVAGLSALQAGAAKVVMENRFLQPDGGTVHLQWVARGVPGTDVWWAVGRDTTAFHRLAAEQLDLRTRLDLALGEADVAAWDLDVGTGRLSWEPQAAGVLGLPEDALPQGPAELAATVHPEDAGAVLAAVAQLREHGTTRVELRVGEGAALRHLSLRGKVLERDRRGRPRRAVGIVLDITAEKAMEEQLLRMVMHDALTGVPNRRAFDHALRSEWRRCTRASQPLTVVMVDIDDFKQFNDTYGHLVGDAALTAVARALKVPLQRAGDALARFGGEEFALVLPGVDARGAVVVGQRLVDAVRQVALRQAPDHVLTVSVGSATWLPGSAAQGATDLLGHADRALYASKAAGKDRASAWPGTPEVNLVSCTGPAG